MPRDPLPTVYYGMWPLDDGDPDRYFRVASGGVFSRWDPDTKTWIPVPNLRDFYSRAIAGGDAWPVRLSDIPGAH
jgi:hypothetical protein